MPFPVHSDKSPMARNFFLFLHGFLFFFIDNFNLKFRLLFEECGRPKPSQHRFLDKTRDARRREVWNALHLSSAWAYFSWYSPFFVLNQEVFFPPNRQFLSSTCDVFDSPPRTSLPLQRKTISYVIRNWKKKKKEEEIGIDSPLSLSVRKWTLSHLNCFSFSVSLWKIINKSLFFLSIFHVHKPHTHTHLFR